MNSILTQAMANVDAAEAKEAEQGIVNKLSSDDPTPIKQGSSLTLIKEDVINPEEENEGDNSSDKVQQKAEVLAKRPTNTLELQRERIDRMIREANEKLLNIEAVFTSMIEELEESASFEIGSLTDEMDALEIRMKELRHQRNTCKVNLNEDKKRIRAEMQEQKSAQQKLIRGLKAMRKVIAEDEVQPKKRQAAKK